MTRSCPKGIYAASRRRSPTPYKSAGFMIEPLEDLGKACVQQWPFLDGRSPIDRVSEAASGQPRKPAASTSMPMAVIQLPATRTAMAIHAALRRRSQSTRIMT